MRNRKTQKILLMPKCVLPKKFKKKKIFFLAGPIRGGGMWQLRAANAIWKKYPGSVVVDPTRWDNALKDAKSERERKIIEKHIGHAIGKKDEILYPAQAPWESHYMKKAAKKGTLIFWFEKESENNPRPKNEGVYAQDTRVETGIWIERVHNNPKLQVKFGGHWTLDENGRETHQSFGGMNFIVYYLTGEKDRRKVYKRKVKNKYFVLAKNIEEFIAKAI